MTNFWSLFYHKIYPFNQVIFICCTTLIREKNTCNEKPEKSLLSTSAIYIHFSDSFPHIYWILRIGRFVKLRGKKQNLQKSWNIIQAETNSVKVVTPIFGCKVGQTKLPVNNEWFNCGAVYSTPLTFVPFLIFVFRSMSQSILHYPQAPMGYIIYNNINIMQDYNRSISP